MRAQSPQNVMTRISLPLRKHEAAIGHFLDPDFLNSHVTVYAWQLNLACVQHLM